VKWSRSQRLARMSAFGGKADIGWKRRFSGEIILSGQLEPVRVHNAVAAVREILGGQFEELCLDTKPLGNARIEARTIAPKLVSILQPRLRLTLHFWPSKHGYQAGIILRSRVLRNERKD